MNYIYNYILYTYIHRVSAVIIIRKRVANFTVNYAKNTPPKLVTRCFATFFACFRCELIK